MNASKKGDINGNKTNILGIIHTENITNWNQLKNTSSWINIDLTDYLGTQTHGNISFSFISESIQDLAKFEIHLLNGNGDRIKFAEQEQKVPQIKFAIEVIQG